MSHALVVAGASITALALAACGAAPSAEPGPEATSGGEMTVAENTNAPAPEPAPEAAPSERAPGWPGRTGSGRTADDPVGACGPGDSYAFVANEFRCPDGVNPLAGDPAAGARARVGNVGANATGHIIDLYRVPCATGPVDVYVDMYGCRRMQGRLGR